MKHIILVLLATAVYMPHSALADGLPYLTVTRANGAETSYELKDLKITFTAADMLLTGNGTAESVPLSALGNARMRFTELATAIGGTVAEHTAIVSRGDRLDITAPAAATLRIYSDAGLVVMTRKISQGTTAVDISRLTAGIYIVKMGNKAIKIEKR